MGAKDEESTLRRVTNELNRAESAPPADPQDPTLVAGNTDPLLSATRLAALRQLRLLDTGRMVALDRLTRLAARLLRAPVALVSLVDDHRQHFKSQIGLPEPWASTRETPLSHSFCQHVVRDAAPLIVNDARKNPLVRENPAIEELGVLAYAGVPLLSPDGERIGSFCVIDHEPRLWQPGEVGLLSELAASVMSEIRLHSQIVERTREVLKHDLWIHELPFACAECHLDGRIREWNLSAERVMGWTTAQARTRALHELLGLETPFEVVDGCREISCSCANADGNRRDLVCRLTPIPNPDGGFDGFVALLEDQTDLRLAERRREESESLLRQAQRLESLGTFAAGIAHEFNNQLAVIQGNLGLAEHCRGDSQEFHRSIEEASVAVGRAKKLTQRMLAFARRNPIEARPCHLDQVVAEALEMAKRMIPGTVTLEVETGADLPAVLADPILVEQVVINLLTNACDAIGPHPGTIRVTFCPVRATGDDPEIPGRGSGPFVRLSVRDTGTGMDAETIQRAFDPFFTTKPPGQGTRLGLSVVHGIMDDHRGAVSVRSGPGRGSEFDLYFPVAETPAGSRLSAAPEDADSTRGTESILLVDDESSIAEMLTRLLRLEDYGVSPFTEPARALDAFRRNPDGFDLVIADHRMPVMDGITLAKRIRAVNARVPIVILSGSIDDSLRLKALEVGAYEVIEKGLPMHHLCEAIQRALLGSRRWRASAGVTPGP